MAKKLGYVEAVRESCPSLIDLDEQPIDHFEPDAQIESGSDYLPIVTRLLEFGVPEDQIEAITSDEPFIAISKEPDHMAILSHKMHKPKEASSKV